MKTKTVEVDGQAFTIAKLTLDAIEAWEDETKALATGATSMAQVHDVQRRACAAALTRAGKTDPALVGGLDIDGLSQLVAEVMSFSNMVGGAPGEAPGTP